MLKILTRFTELGASSSSSSSSQINDLKGPLIDDLPPEVLEKIFSFLPFRDSYGACRRVCSKWNCIILSNVFRKVYPPEVLKSIDRLETFSEESTRHSWNVSKQIQEVQTIIADPLFPPPLTSLVLSEKRKTAIPLHILNAYISNANPFLINLKLESKKNQTIFSDLNGYTFSRIKHHSIISLHLIGTSTKIDSSQLFTFFGHGSQLRSVHIEDKHLLFSLPISKLLTQHKMMENLVLIGKPEDEQIKKKFLFDIVNYGHNLTRINLTLPSIVFEAEAIHYFFNNIKNLRSLTFVTGSLVPSSLKDSLRLNSPNLKSFRVKHIKNK